jgi:hypothetical protein
MALSQVEKLFNSMSKGASRPTVIVLVLFLVIGLILVSYDKTFKSPVDSFAEYPSAHNAPVKNEVAMPVPEVKTSSLNNDLLPKTNNSELINNNVNTGFTDLIGSSNLRDTRNANLQLRADPPIAMIETGPFNKSTITADRKSTGLNVCGNV